MRYSFIILIFLLYVLPSASQTQVDYLVRYGMVLKLAEQVEWPQSSVVDKFQIGVIEKNFNDSVTSVIEIVKKAKVQGKSINIKRFKKISDVKNVNILYINDELPIGFNLILERLIKEHVLLITNNVQDKRMVMINLYEDNDKVKFEINKANIINAGLNTKPKLILLGGTEIDVASLYQDTKEDLDREKIKVTKQQEELNKLREEIEETRKEVELQKNQISQQKQEIEQKRQEITDQSKKLKNLHDNISKQENLLKENIDKFNSQKIKLTETESTIAEKEATISLGNQELAAITTEIEKQKDELNKQKREIIKQYSTIKLQENLLYIAIGFLFLIVAVAFLIYKGYKNQKGFTAKLTEKNGEIYSQKEGLKVQAENLYKANLEIEDLYINLKDSIRAAQLIQQSILPSEKVIAKYLPEFFILNKPKDVVSGDFYWFDVVDEHIIIAAADCTGHGVSGALMSMIGHNILEQSVSPNKSLKASEILDNLNDGLIKQLHQGESGTDLNDGMDIALCVISPDKKNLQFSGANSPLYILRNRELIQIKSDKYPIGLTERPATLTYKNHEVALQEGDIVYMFSDGYADQIGGDLGTQKFMYPKFRELLLQIGSEEMQEQRDKLNQAIENWRGSREQLDDILVIGYKI